MTSQVEVLSYKEPEYLTPTERRLVDMFNAESTQRDDEVTVQRMAFLWKCKEDKARERLKKLCASGLATVRPGVARNNKRAMLYKIVEMDK